MNFSKVMSLITAALYVAIAAYALAWYSGKVQGDISVSLLILLVITFAYWLLEKFYLRSRRLARAISIEQQIRAQTKGQASEAETVARIRKAVGPELAQPWWIEWTAGFFWVIFVVFFLRSFVVEPFKIPSGSMRPTLETGDFILVNKFQYGVRLPVANTKITSGTPPQRGDVIVFRYPPNEQITYIKRIVGLPGDEVVYRDKVLMINGQEIPQANMRDAYYEDMEVDGRGRNVLIPFTVKEYEEKLGPITHHIFIDPKKSGSIAYGQPTFPLGQNCYYNAQGFSCKVPEGHYFAMGDNRDNSADSRYWGFVPEGNIVGKAFFVWMNFGKFSRIGGFD